MYVGGKDATGAFRLYREIVDNAVDEHNAGFGNLVQVYYNTKTGYFVIADRGRGVPVDKHERTGESALTVVFTKLHAGGKFTPGVYKNSGGLHGVGASCTNALSDSFEAWSYRSAGPKQAPAWHYQKFSKGSPLTAVIKSDPPKPLCDAKAGTIIRFHPDPEIFGAHVADPERVFSETRDLAMLNSKLTIQLAIDERRWSFNYPDGIVSMALDPKAPPEALMAQPFRMSEAVGESFIDLAMAWYDDDSASLRSFVNSMCTSNGGNHVKGLHAALTKALRDASGTEYEARYWMMGLRVALHWKMSDPAYRSQTKEELSSEVTNEVRDAIQSKLALWFKQQPNMVRKLLDRAEKFRKNEERFRAENKAIKALEVAGKDDQAIDPSKFIQADSWVPAHLRETFLVEGDSAGGTCFTTETVVQLINGESKTFADLILDAKNGIKNYGYAYSIPDNKIVAVELDEPRVTKTTTELIEIELSNGRVERCTPDHLWLLADGSYVRADHLTSESVLMPHTEYVHNGRRYVLSPRIRPNGKLHKNATRSCVFHLTAKLNKKAMTVAKKLAAQGAIVQMHHIDCDSLNDHPGNIQAIDERKHRLLHGSKSRFSRETTLGALNAHSRKMREDADYRAEATKRAKEHFSTYWGDLKHREDQASRTKQHFQNPANRAKTKAANIAATIATYREILSRCSEPTEAAFNEARAAVAADRGVRRINIRFDYCVTFFKGSIRQLFSEVRHGA